MSWVPNDTYSTKNTSDVFRGCIIPVLVFAPFVIIVTFGVAFLLRMIFG
jgi:hypothetical protein